MKNEFINNGELQNNPQNPLQDDSDSISSICQELQSDNNNCTEKIKTAKEQLRDHKELIKSFHSLLKEQLGLTTPDRPLLTFSVLSVPPRTIIDFINFVEQSAEIKTTNNKALSMALRLAFYCALELKEILELQIDDIPCDKPPLTNDDFKISSTLTLPERINIGKKCSRFICLPPKIIEYIISYITHLKQSPNINIGTSSHLIFSKGADKYDRKTFENHIKRYFEHDDYRDYELSFNKIRNLGICNYYCRLIKSSKSQDKAKHEAILIKTAEFARMKDRNTKDIIENYNIKKNPPRAPKYKGQIDNYDEWIHFLQNTKEVRDIEFFHAIRAIKYLDLNDDKFKTFCIELFKAIDQSKDLEWLENYFADKGDKLRIKKMFKRVFISNCNDKKKGIPPKNWREVKFKNWEAFEATLQKKNMERLGSKT